MITISPTWADAVAAFTAWAVIAMIAPGTDAAPPTAEASVPKPLPEKIMMAWTDAEGEFGWLRVEDFSFDHMQFHPDGRPLPADLPAFQVRNWKQGRIPILPIPEAAFGLYFSPVGATTVTDAGLKDLSGLKSLRTLILRRCDVSDAGIKELAGLKELQWLEISSAKITDAGLKDLAEIKNLRTLSLEGAAVTGAQFAELKKLGDLRALYLCRSKVTDAGLKELASLMDLESLDLRVTNVTKIGLKELTALKNLKTLYLPSISARRTFPSRSASNTSRKAFAFAVSGSPF